MFTGIVTDIGRVRSVRQTERDWRYEIETAWDTSGIDLGASISHAGCCLTVTEKGPGWFSVEGTIVGDGRVWHQARFNAFPSKRAFLAVVTDPERRVAQKDHREKAIADTYTMIVRPTIDRLAESVDE